jgi:hypothetical protein
LRPGQTRGHADLVLFFLLSIPESMHTQVFLYGLGCYLEALFAIVFCNLSGHFPADGSNFALQVPHTRLPGITTDDRLNSVRGKLDVLFS